MKTDTTELLQQIRRLQDDKQQLQRVNDMLAITIDQLHEIVDAWGLRQIVDRWQQERELLSYTPAQRN